MTHVSVQLAGEGDRDRWDAFVEAHPDANYCLRWSWRQIFERVYGKPCYYLFASDPSATAHDQLKGALPLVHMQGKLGGNSLVSLPYLDLGGVLADCAATSERLAEAALELLGTIGAARLELRGISFSNADAAATTHRYRFVLPLCSSEEELWKAIGPKVRNQVRKSERQGLETRKATEGDLSRFYAVFARNMRDLGSPVHSKRLFREVLSRFGSDAHLYLTTDARGKPVAGGISIRFRDSIVVPWACSLHSARPSCPNHSLYWRILRDGLAEGVSELDFGRSSEGTGTFRFKKQWGGRAEPLFWTSYDGCGQARSAEAALSASENPRLATLWSRLPLGLANRIGPILRGQLSN